MQKAIELTLRILSDSDFDFQIDKSSIYRAPLVPLEFNLHICIGA